jgi:hypothetical protein
VRRETSGLGLVSLAYAVRPTEIVAKQIESRALTGAVPTRLLDMYNSVLALTIIMGNP